MNKTIFITTLLLFSAIGFRSIAGIYNFRGTTYSIQQSNTNGKFNSKYNSYNNTFKIIIDTDKNFVNISYGNKSYSTPILHSMVVEGGKKSEVLFYCPDKVLIKLYTDDKNTKHIMFSSENMVMLFDC